MSTTPPPATRAPSEGEIPAAVPRARLILLLLALFSLINFGDKAVLGLAGPDITHDLHLTNTQFGTIGSAFYLLFSVSALVTGLVSHRLPATWLLAGMALLWSVMQLPILLPAAGFAALIGTRVVLGAGEAPGLPMANHVAFTWVPPPQRTTASGWITMGGALGVILGGPLLAAVIALAGWRWSFGLLGLFGLAWTAAWWWLGGEGPYRRTAAGPGDPIAVPEERDATPLARILLSRTWLSATVAVFAGNWVTGLALSWLPTFLEHEAGYRATTVGFLVGLPSFVAVLAVPLVTWLARRRFRAGRSAHSTYALLGMGCGVVTALALLLMTAGPAPVPLLGAVAFSFGASIPISPLASAAVGDLVSVGRRGVALCTMTAAGALGSVVSPWATGRLLDLAGTERAGFATAFRVAAVVALVAGLAMLLVDPERDRRRLLA